MTTRRPRPDDLADGDDRVDEDEPWEDEPGAASQAVARTCLRRPGCDLAGDPRCPQQCGAPINLRLNQPPRPSGQQGSPSTSRPKSH